jgi:hypothetical protein
MSTNEKANGKLDKKNNDETIVEVSSTEANAVAGGAGLLTRPPDLNPEAIDASHTPDP